MQLGPNWLKNDERSGEGRYVRGCGIRGNVCMRTVHELEDLVRDEVVSTVDGIGSRSRTHPDVDTSLLQLDEEDGTEQLSSGRRHWITASTQGSKGNSRRR